MPILIVVNDPKDWPFQIPGVEVVDARSYLTRPEYSDMRGVKLFNLCRTYRYQSTATTSRCWPRPAATSRCRASPRSRT